MGPDHTPTAPHRALPARGLLLLTLALAACAAPPPRTPPRPPPPAPAPAYVPPTSGPTARLVMRGSVSPGGAYGIYRFADTEHCAQVSSVGFGDATKTPASTTLAAGVMTTLQLTIRLSPTFACYMRWSFVPVAGKHYLIAGNGSLPTQCEMRLLDATDGDDIKPELTALRRDSKQNACIPMSQARTAINAPAPASASASSSNNKPVATDTVLMPNATDQDLRGLVGQ